MTASPNPPAGRSTPPSGVVISASLAYDHIMTFPGSLAEHILPEKAHVLSVSFLVDSLRRQRGGIAGNIAYNLALLAEPSAVVGAVGPDFAPYRDVFTSLGIDTSHVLAVPDDVTASCFITTDRRDNQIAGFYPGASRHADTVSVRDLAGRSRLGVVAPTTPEAMRRHAAEMADAGCPYIYDPSQQVVVLSPEDLLMGIDRAWAVVGNDYEFAMIERKTGLTIANLIDRVALVSVTYGAEGSELHRGDHRARIPAVTPDPVTDPTGAGDAYRGGLIKGLLLGLDLAVTGRLAALAATYAIERHGTQEHSYSADAFVARFDRVFPDFAGAITVDALRAPAGAGRPLLDHLPSRDDGERR